jgi:hypothetical protein
MTNPSVAARRYSAQVAMSICDQPADGESLRCSISSDGDEEAEDVDELPQRQP